MRLNILFILVLIMGGLSTAMADQSFVYSGYGMGICLGPVHRGQQLTIQSCGVNEFWTAMPSDNGSFRIVSKYSGLCLSVAGARLKKGSAVVQYFCDGANNENWRFKRLKSGQMIIVLATTSGCLSILPDQDGEFQLVSCSEASKSNWGVADVNFHHKQY